jgi:outer membrane protein OmpA-like peptidoglycan-associated protein/ABC-type nitrate/sulfonate/bicarbonate transport system substrate-binding protein
MEKRHWIAFAVIAVLLVAGIGSWKVVTDWMFASKQIQASDATTKTTAIRGAGDDYQGYFFLVSPEMKKIALGKGFTVNFTNDKGDYAARLKAFSERKYDFIVLPINSYITEGKQYGYPGRIVGAIAESKGADALVCFQNVVPTGKVTDLNNAALHIVYTGGSPSSFLLDSMITNFDLDNLRRGKDWRVELGGSEAVLAKAKAGEGDCFVMWEPQVQQALAADSRLKVVYSSKDFSGYIVDVIVMHRDFITERTGDAVRFLESYFATMRSYAGQRKQFMDDMALVTGLKGDVLKAVLDEIHWYDLAENASQMFGLNMGVSVGVESGIYNVMADDIMLLRKTKQLDSDPLSDPRTIVNSALLGTVLQRLPVEMAQNTQKRSFVQLSDSEWKTLKEMGTLRDTEITFQQGTYDLTLENASKADAIGDLLAKNYPDTRVIVRGHTAPGDDEEENVRLSSNRAEAVLKRLTVVKGIDPNRIRAEGVGSAMPPTRRQGESPRDMLNRRSRVEIILYHDRSF